MKNILLKTFILLTWLITGNQVKANHIVGGELRMKSVGSGKFEISLIQYWDKKNLIIPTPTVGGNRDPDAELYIYSKRNNMLMDLLTVTYNSTSQIEYQNKACATSRSLETLTGIYTGTISLQSGRYNDPEGYYIVWERCCRNDDINNIVNPGENGMVFYLEFPPLTVVNTSPVFQAPNGQYICINRDFTMNMSATDEDGDELRYTLVTPMRGNTSPDDPIGNDSRKNGYPLVTWINGVSLNNVISGSQPLRIDNDGLLKVNANRIGLYVFTIQCEELRNGKRIGLVRRDFQLLVIDCNDETPEQPVVMVDNKPVNEISFCPQNPIELKTDTSAEWSYQWQLNGLNIPGATNSTIMVSDTGNYSVVKSFSQKCSKDTASSSVHATFKTIEAVITEGKSVLCKNDSTTLLANGGLAGNDLTFSWKRNDVSIANGTSSQIKVHEAGLYELTVRDELEGCIGNDSILISNEDIIVDLPEKASIIEGSRITLSPQILPQNLSYSYQWSPPNGIIGGDPTKREIVVSPALPTDYLITVVSQNGCTGTATIMLNVIEKMHIPTAFSPNSDGVNDTFEIYNAKDQIETIEVYNRWGEVIFHSDGYEKPWNGTYKNNPVPAGSYTYVIKTTEREIRGDVLLLQ
ncbi:gliding motility-associated C-terminal domain-containing protein [Dyadobacter sp. NIV53]|uniref:gliding motility-associated C-terminal domain-containing protein n=1 Tax=Dyadobacter sp. NIV53 TaxID=2861765 RepID=UPI001C88564F|nr:gliding motility-associated C-terminal domain-containing protein [Dyadobacter sp. NIV53]